MSVSPDAYTRVAHGHSRGTKLHRPYFLPSFMMAIDTAALPTTAVILLSGYIRCRRPGHPPAVLAKRMRQAGNHDRVPTRDAFPVPPIGKRHLAHDRRNSRSSCGRCYRLRWQSRRVSARERHGQMPPRARGPRRRGTRASARARARSRCTRRYAELKRRLEGRMRRHHGSQSFIPPLR
jgi:hypothetical protein